MKTEEVFLVLVFSFAIATTAHSNIEGDVLNAWKTQLSDPNNVLQSWDPTLVNPCTWFHISCDIQNRVTRVDLGVANLSGTLIPQLGQLANLQYLHVFGNKLSGAIPVEIANLTKLEVLGLDHNQLTGIIPSELGRMKSLRSLRLNSNKFSGILPDSIVRLINHGSLQLLNVSDNNLAGTFKANNETEFFTTTVIQDPKLPKHGA
ncbi:hypothetical protein M9H77_10376 [Catharanthus roseus]|uniref:Uncharacterized protein n=1 Tax=Catharanthus roseus TaxID=4058 RepID=A0ACC0C3A8_CATRO|nr:hypothetical protein M9H77_10376 [Catharanthus roseus]